MSVPPGPVHAYLLEALGVEPTVLDKRTKRGVDTRLAPYKYPRWIEFID